MKTNRMLFVAALMASLCPIAMAQDSRLPQASLDRDVGVQVPIQAAVPGKLPHQTLTPPKYCKPCLFYAGDFDSNASDANGLANEKDIIISTGAATYTPFIVPKGKTWTVTGLFTVNILLDDSGNLEPKVIPYEVRKDISKAGGDGGKLVCHDKKPGVMVYQYNPSCEDWVNCWVTVVKGIKACQLTSGRYWMSVVPYCIKPGVCDRYRSFLANDDGAMANRYGPLEPANNSFFNSQYYGAVWEPSSKQQNSVRFSVGVEGTQK